MTSRSGRAPKATFRGPHEAWLVRLCYGATLAIIHQVISDALERDPRPSGRTADDVALREGREALLYMSAGARGFLGMVPLVLFVITTVGDLWRFGVGVLALTLGLTAALGVFVIAAQMALMRVLPDRIARLMVPRNYDLAWQFTVVVVVLVISHRAVDWP